MTSTADPRHAASERITQLVAILKAQPGREAAGIIEECEALGRAVEAFHLEGIRFRIYNVDRLIAKAGTAAPPDARVLLDEIRHNLEAAGFHTRSHQAPG